MELDQFTFVTHVHVEAHRVERRRVNGAELAVKIVVDVEILQTPFAVQPQDPCPLVRRYEKNRFVRNILHHLHDRETCDHILRMRVLRNLCHILLVEVSEGIHTILVDMFRKGSENEKGSDIYVTFVCI